MKKTTLPLSFTSQRLTNDAMLKITGGSGPVLIQTNSTIDCPDLLTGSIDCPDLHTVSIDCPDLKPA